MCLGGTAITSNRLKPVLASMFRWNSVKCRSEYDPIKCESNRTIAEYFNVKVLTEDYLNEYKKLFFVGPKANFTICTQEDLSVISPVKEFWE